eukprot:403352004
MSKISDSDRKAYEAYILASSEEDRQEAIKKLIPGSHLYYHLYFIDRMKKVGGALLQSEEDQKLLQQFKKKYGKGQHSSYYKQIETRLNFMAYDSAQTEEERDKVLEELVQKQLYLSFNFEKPDELQRARGALDTSSSQAPDESESEQDDLSSDEHSNMDMSIDEDNQNQNQNANDCESMSRSRSRSGGRRRIDSGFQNNDDEEYEDDSHANSIGNRMPRGRQLQNMEIYESEDIQNQEMQDEFIQEPARIRSPQPRIKTNKNEFNYERYFGKAKIAKRFQAKKSDEQDSKKKLKRLPAGFEHKIDFTKYHVKAVGDWANSQGLNKIADLTNESFYTALKGYFDLMFQKDKHFALSQSFCNALTLAQLDKIATLHPKIKEDKTFVGSYFNKQFHDELSQENQEIWSNEEKRANLLHLYNYAKSKDMPQSLQSSLLIEVLDLGIKLSIYDEDLFRQYLAIPQRDEGKFFKTKRKAQNDHHWNQYIKNVQCENTKQGKWESQQRSFILKYLEIFCQQKGTLESFKEELDTKYLKTIEERHQIYSSDDMTNLNVDLSKYQEVSAEVIVRFLESNQEQFKVNEEVKLSLELKNVQTLYVKIFEFNTETYYKKNLQPFNTGVNLDGLVASIEKQYQYNHPPNRKFVENFQVPELTDKVGLFIVEFIGNGMSSRAIIKKGSLSLIHRSTVAGHLAYILDENKNVCSGSKTGLQFDGQFYKADDEKGGKIFIPYGKHDLSSKAILMNNDFAQLCDFTRATEIYKFKAFIYVNNESLLIGNVATILIQPNLMINDSQAPLNVLKNTKVTLTITNYIDSIPITKQFENLKFDKSNFLTLDFQVPPYLSNVQVALTSEIHNVTLDTTQNFSVTKNIQVQTHQYDKNMTELYLRKQQGDFYLYLLGKNGEPKPKQTISVQFAHLYFPQDSIESSVSLITDQEGKVKLGNLKKIAMIRASCSNVSEKMFFITQERQNLTYHSRLDIIENETIELPVLFNKKTRKNVSLIRKSDGSVLEDYFDKIEYILQNEKDFNLIRVTNLQDGKYILSIKDIKKEIHINVHRGTYWDNNNFILKRNCLMENKTTKQVVKIESVKIEEAKEGKSEIKVKIQDFSENCRVFIMANQFESSFSSMEFWKLLKMQQNSQSQVIFPFALWKNIFMSDRELSDEYRYVFDRKYAERQLGNTLERPRLVLKRSFIQATQIEQQALKSGTEYESIQLQQQVQPVYQSIAPQARRIDKMSMLNNCQSQAIQLERKYDDSDDEECYRGNSYGGNSYDSDQGLTYDKMKKSIDDQFDGKFSAIPEFQNFLKHSALLILNKKPDENGTLSFTATLSGHTQLHVLVIDYDSLAKKQVDIPLENLSIPRRDLSLNQTLETEKGFTESRTSQILQNSEQNQVEDITSTEIQIIDDLTKVRAILDSLTKQNYVNNDQSWKDLLPIFMKWSTYSNEEKNKHFNKNFSHELNIFIFLKDRTYFDSVVKPYLKNKMEKQFIDHYLLGNQEEVSKYANIESVSKLNVMEICFLFDTLVDTQQIQEANKLLAYLNIQRIENDKQFKQSSFNKIFDTILNMNIGKDGEGIGISLANTVTPGYGKVGAKRFTSSAMPIRAQASSRNNNQQMEMMYDQSSEECEEDNDENACDSDNDSMECSFKEVSKKRKMKQSNRDRDRRSSFDRDVMGERKRQIKAQRQAFEEIQKTSEYMETHYYQQNFNNQNEHLLQFTGFWFDYAEHLINKKSLTSPFLSLNFIQNGSNGLAALMTFAFLDLPINAEAHQFKTNEGRGLQITANGQLILLKKEVREAPLELTNDILITHRYIKQNDDSSTAAAIPEEFLTNTAYSCEVIMTNVSPQQKDFSILYQIPQGSVPLQTTKYMKSQVFQIGSYTTQKVIFDFYFPKEGNFTHFPSSASQNEKIIARAQTHQLKVVYSFSIRKSATFMDILITGSKDDILEFLRTKNLKQGEMGFSFSYIYWMLKDKAFYQKAIDILKERYIYDQTFWSFAFYHKDDEVTMKEYLKITNFSQYNTDIGTHLQTKLLNVEPQDQSMKHLDYYPMMNARAHLVGDVQQWALNKNLRETFEKLLNHLILKDDLKLEEKMILVYNFQLQDRIPDAIRLLNSIEIEMENPTESLKIQYDYMSAYFDFFTGEAERYKTARTIVRKYEDYPVASWRILFLEILDQLNELDGEIEDPMDFDGELLTDEQQRLKQKKSAKKEPRLEVEVESEKQNIQIEVTNFRSIVIKFYIIDAEILFSRTPFLKESTSEFSYVKPCHVIQKDLSATIDLNASIDTITYLQHPQKFDLEIPETLKHQNMVIEINGEGKQVFKTYYPTQIKVNILAEYGELKVTDREGKVLPKVYVKVFYQKRGGSTAQASFFKDGYTDIRGKFEYAQTSGDKLKEVTKFAIFVMSDTLGSLIKEVDPPKMEEGGENTTVQLQQRKEQRIYSKVINSKKAKKK